MADTLHTPKEPLKDRNYDLIRVLEASLQNAWRLETYITDADRAGDAELAEWFRKIQHNSFKAGEQGKHLLHARLSENLGSSSEE